MVASQQKEVCSRYNTEWVAADLGSKVGITTNARGNTFPLKGVRHIPAADTTGWYIYAGDKTSQDSDWYKPLHVEHLREFCPMVLKYLGLPPGWGFVVAPGYEDVWEDKTFLVK